MTTEKLIGLITKKETYKDLKPYFVDISKNKEQTVHAVIDAVRTILSTTYNTEAKLYSVRFIKDCVELANPLLIERVEKKVLPTMFQIALDEQDVEAVTKYAGSSYTKAEDLSKFKTLLTSLFRICKECILKWAEWMPGPAHQFSRTEAQLRRRKALLKFEFKYFQPDKTEIFKENCLKMGFEVNQLPDNGPSKAPPASSLMTKVEKIGLATRTFKPPEPQSKLVRNLEDILLRAERLDEEDFSSLEREFNEAVNRYIETDANFDDVYLQGCFERFDSYKAYHNLKKQSNKVDFGAKLIESKYAREAPQLSEEGRLPVETPNKIPRSPRNTLKEETPTQKVSFPRQKEVVERVYFTQSSREEGSEQNAISPRNQYGQKLTAIREESNVEETERRIQAASGVSKENSRASSGALQKMAMLRKDLEREKAEKNAILQSRLKMERQIQNLKRGHSADPAKSGLFLIDNLEGITQELKQERKMRNTLDEENRLLRQEMQRLRRGRQEESGLESQKSRQSALPSQLNSQVRQRQKIFQSKYRNVESDRELVRTVLDPDYAKDLTHPAHIRKWLNENNANLFKKSVLGLSEMFYRGDYVCGLVTHEAYAKDGQSFVASRYTFQFNTLRKVSPSVTYHNSAETEVWTKPMEGDELLHSQEVVVRLANWPMKILKASIKLGEGLENTYLLPIVHFNFLQHQEFMEDQFDDVLDSMKDFLMKSKITPFNSSVIKETGDLKKVFPFGKISGNSIKFCLAQADIQGAFMGNLEFLKGQKFLLRMLAAPSSPQLIEKAKEIMDQLVFLLS